MSREAGVVCTILLVLAATLYIMESTGKSASLETTDSFEILKFSKVVESNETHGFSVLEFNQHITDYTFKPVKFALFCLFEENPTTALIDTTNKKVIFIFEGGKKVPFELKGRNFSGCYVLELKGSDDD